MDLPEIRDFQSKQAEVVALIGAFSAILRNFAQTLNHGNGHQPDVTTLRRLLPQAGEFAEWLKSVSAYYHQLHYQTYYQSLKVNSLSVITLLSHQTLPSKALAGPDFLQQLWGHINVIDEVMLATAKIVISPIDINIKAQSPFSAYLFLLSVLKASTELILIVDQYVDRTIFHRYLASIETSVHIKIVNDEDTLKKKNELAAFVDIEKLFIVEHPHYSRESRKGLHDRYLITETHAYVLGGSFKDAAKKADFSVTEVSEAKRKELIRLYT